MRQEERTMAAPRFRAGIWHFATYVDRYATNGYGAPRTIVEAIDLAGKVPDLSVVDLNWPFFGGDFSNSQIKAALDRNKLSAIGITPEIYTRQFAKGVVDPALMSTNSAMVKGTGSFPRRCKLRTVCTVVEAELTL
jgi:hypothetical protein